MKDRIIMLILACTLITGMAQAQNVQQGQTGTLNGEVVYDEVDNMPRYPGGNEALFKFLAENIQYPKTAFEAGIGGRVIVEFVIDKDGNVTKPRILKSIHPQLDAEALRVVKAMPKWIPGLKNYEPVNVKYVLPVMFNISDKVEDAKTEKSKD